MKRRIARRNGGSREETEYRSRRLGFDRAFVRASSPRRGGCWPNQELFYRDLEKVLGDQDDLAASRDEDPAEDSTDISADMYAYLLNRLKGRTLDWEPLLVRDGRLIVAVHPRSCLGAWRQATGAGSASGTQLHLSEIQVELACWGNHIWQHDPDGRIVPRRCRSSA